MTKAEELLALAHRCETEDPSRELSEAIAFCAGWRLRHAIWWRNPLSQKWEMGAPKFTFSLDDAVTLIPPNCYPKHWGRFCGHGDLWQCEVGGYTADFVEISQCCEHAARTGALALCAAALRARAALLTDGAVPSRTA